MDILCVGTLVADILVYPIDQINFDIDLQTVDKIEIQNGGDGMNAAVIAAKLSNKVGMLGAIGKDEFGSILQQQLEKHRIDLRGLCIREEVPTSRVIVLIRHDGKRNFLFLGGANHTFHFDDININLIKEANIVHIGGFYQMPRFDGDGSARLMQMAKSMGKTTTMDVNWDHSGKWRQTIEYTLKYVDYFLPSEEEAGLITGQSSPWKMADSLLDMGTKNVLIKMGDKGAYFKNAQSCFKIATHKVQAIDTTGAGDSFVAGFLTGLIQGWGIKDCARFGTSAASFCVKKIGSTAGITSYEEVFAYMQNDPVEIIEECY